MAAVLAVTTVLAAGLTVFPGSVQEAQANPCSNNADAAGGDDGISGVAPTGPATGGIITTGDDQQCNFVGPTEFDED